MNAVYARAFFAATLLAALPVFAQVPDKTANRLHFFPLVAVGGEFQTTLFLANASHIRENLCTLDLHGPGMSPGSFYSHEAVKWSGARATIELDDDHPSLRIFSRGTRSLAFGYANMDCAEPVVVRTSLALYGPESIDGMAFVPESQRGTNFHFPVLPRSGELGLVFSNDSGSRASCSIRLNDEHGRELDRNSFPVPGNSTSLHFLDELVGVPRGFGGGSARVSCNLGIGALGLPLNTPAFSSLASVLPRGDIAAERTQFIPLVVDGDGFRSQLTVTNSAPATNRCTLVLKGAELANGRFDSFHGSSATFELESPGGQKTFVSTGGNSLAYGHARLECEQAAVARNLLIAETRGRLAGMATIPGAPTAEDIRFPVLPRSDEFALVFANDTGADIDCNVWYDDYRLSVLDIVLLTVPSNSVELRFVDELFEGSEDEGAYSVHATCSGPVATIGMPLNGAVFSAIPPILLGPPDRIVTAPLLIDADGCSNGRFVDNPGGNTGMARDCSAVVEFANALIAGGSTAADLPVRQWGRGEQVRIDDWAGIGIDGGRVSAINLPDLGLRGAISLDLERLDALTLIDLSNNELTGKIPPELGQLRSLTSIFLHGNRLTGPIPPELAQLTELSQLSLGSNRLTGPIPPEFTNLRKLLRLNLKENFLSGEIPPELWLVSELLELDLSDNRLTGEIPWELGRLRKIRDLDLSRNQLSGPVPRELSWANELIELHLDRNELTGPIPPQLANLENLWLLNLTGNELTGAIPVELAELPRLYYLFLGLNELTGSIPEVFADMRSLRSFSVYGNNLEGAIPVAFARTPNLRRLNVGYNDFSGTLPRVFWDKMARGELFIATHGTRISGVESPVVNRPDPDYSTDPTANGNAVFHSISLFQGPLALEVNADGSRVEYQTPIVNRRAALAVSIDHEVRTPPLVAGRVSNETGRAPGAQLQPASVYSTERTGDGQWRTEYVFDLPGAMFIPENRVVFVIDPENELPETNEADNQSEPIVLAGEAAPNLHVTFLPFHQPGEDPPVLDANLLMKGIEAYYPISGNYIAEVGPAVELDSTSTGPMLARVRELWNLEAEPDEFYHGISYSPIGGRAALPGRVAISGASIFGTIPHEFGHNLNLRHPPGCDAAGPDHDYPYPEGQLGPDRGWDHNWFRFVSGEIDRFGDVMSYCTEIDFISDYHYEKAWDYWREYGTYSRANSVSTAAVTTEGTPTGSTQAASSEAPQSLALSGGITADGVWSLSQAQVSGRGPRPPAEDGEYRLILYDDAGVQVYEEPLARIAIGDSDESFWAARTPLPLRTAAEIVILDAQGSEVLRQTLPDLE
ncbi:MAG: hypothetical protein F4Y89_10810 [Gammaproteobacteria bacterium]|nr:hypothetical protein [Gammaproteobacteria bacterium]MYG95403.1 hypothetical protein [Gammaproteobacteria bacterium]MYH47792.1 hypothetical protein [Gammaproteobacteria bacterium]MYL13468.1 hypothetical protein [Gammaproteobacteria bacterium]